MINGRHKDSLQKTCEELSSSFTSRPSFMAGTIDFIQGDLSLVKDCEKIVTTVVQKAVKLDVLVNSAGD